MRNEFMNIKIENVSKDFGKSKVLEDINFNINSGDIVCFLGPSGAGKTTLIRLILGAIPATSGEITIEGTVVPNINLLKKIGYTPQNDALYDDLSAEDNLKFFGGLYKISNINEAISRVLKIVDLEKDKRKLVRKYSGGMKKRLSLAIALLHDPDILLLDEPTVGIDPLLRKTIWDEFKKLKEQGKTLVVTTHVMDETRECDKAALIYGGKLIAYDSVEALLKSTKTGKMEELFFERKIS